MTSVEQQMLQWLCPRLLNYVEKIFRNIFFFFFLRNNVIKSEVKLNYHFSQVLISSASLSVTMARIRANSALRFLDEFLTEKRLIP